MSVRQWSDLACWGLKVLLSGSLIGSLALPVWARETEKGESGAEWRAESAQGDVAQITNVQVNLTENGLDIILTATDELVTPSRSVAGNAQIVEIPNAVMTLPDQDEFQAANPVAGIALVTISNLPENRVQVVITGLEAPPTTTISTEAGTLVLEVAPDAASIDETSFEDAIAVDPIRVVVTAERTPEDLQDVPLSITVLSEQQLEDANITSLAGIADNTPNFTFFPVAPTAHLPSTAYAASPTSMPLAATPSAFLWMMRLTTLLDSSIKT